MFARRILVAHNSDKFGVRINFCKLLELRPETFARPAPGERELDHHVPACGNYGVELLL